MMAQRTGVDHPHVKRSAAIVVWLCLVLVAAMPAAVAAETVVASPKQFEAAIAGARQGDIVRIANGRYDGWILKVPPSAKGVASDPIRILPESEGGVVFTGDTNIRLRGDYVELAGFTFESTGKNTITVFGSYNRLRDLVFRDAGDKISTFRGIIVVHPGALDTEIDHNEFYGSTSMSIKVRVRKSKPVPTGTHIHHNLFQDIVRLAKNGQEPIQLGQGGAADVALSAIVEYNQFMRVNADPELISSKTSHNTIRYNLAVDSSGEIVLRSGGKCLVEGNVLFNTLGGIRVSGIGHHIINNFVSTDSGRGIVLTDGTRRYRAAKDNVIAHNTIVSDGRAIFFASFDREVEEAASGNIFVNNILVSTSLRPPLEAKVPEYLAERLAENSFQSNLLWWQADAPAADGVAPPGFTIADPRIEFAENVPALMPDSPAIDAGAEGYSTSDLRSLPRPVGTAPDIGAFEAQ
jgi:poly(beta-D-mannuronate) lyase